MGVSLENGNVGQRSYDYQSERPWSSLDSEGQYAMSRSRAQFNLCSVPSGIIIHASIKNAIQCLCHLWQVVQDSIIGPAVSSRDGRHLTLDIQS